MINCRPSGGKTFVLSIYFRTGWNMSGVNGLRLVIRHSPVNGLQREWSGGGGGGELGEEGSMKG